MQGILPFAALAMSNTAEMKTALSSSVAGPPPRPLHRSCVATLAISHQTGGNSVAFVPPVVGRAFRDISGSTRRMSLAALLVRHGHIDAFLQEQKYLPLLLYEQHAHICVTSL